MAEKRRDSEPVTQVSLARPGQENTACPQPSGGKRQQASSGQLPPVTAGATDGMLCTATRIRQQRKAGRSMSKRSGQSGSVRLVGCKWYGRYWRDVPGKENRDHAHVVLGEKSSMTKPEAKRKLMDIIAAEGVNTPQHLEKAIKPAVTFNSIADTWEKKRLPMLHASSQFIIPARLRLHVRPFFGHMAIEEICTGTVNDWIGSLSAKGLEPKSVINCWKDFRSVVNWQRKQMDKPKVTWYPDLPELPDVEQRWFTQDEIKRIVDTAEGKYKVLFCLAGHTGMRCGELCALRVEDLKLDHGVIEVTRSVWNGIDGRTKTKAGKRVVYLDSETLKMLRDHIGDRKAGRVFESRTGRSLLSQDINRKFLKPICKRLGIPVGTMHAFRHGRASQMQTAGLPGDFVTSQIGHSSLKVTSIYTHFEHEKKRALAEQLLSCTQSADLYTVAEHAKAS
jgi:integrase